MGDRFHERPHARSLALHRRVAERLGADPGWVAIARARVLAWQARGTVSSRWCEAWLRALDGPREDLLALLVDPGPAACDLRQSSPFAGILAPRERWEILRGVPRA